MASKDTITVREVSPTDTVRVTVYRRFGEEQECADTWQAMVAKVDTKNGKLGIITEYGIQWFDPEGPNPDGRDPAYTDTRLQVCKNVEGAQFQRLYNDGPAPEAMTAKQEQFIRTLIGKVQHTWDEEKQANTMARLDEGLTKAKASEWIGRLLDLEKTVPPAPVDTPIADVPAGRYAVTGNDGTTDFYKVDRPTEGRWAGYTFVKLGIGGPYGDPRWERVSRTNTETILAKIAEEGVQEAMERYGRELGHCGHCGRTLTNDESIKRGIGPVCAGRMGW